MPNEEDKAEQGLKPNRDQIKAHLWAYFGPKATAGVTEGQIEVAWGASPNDPPSHARLFNIFDLDAVTDFAVEKNSVYGQNCYIGATLRSPSAAPFGRSEKADFYAATACWVDLDKGDDVAHASKRAKELGFRPTHVVQTGTSPEKRAQIHFALSAPLTDPDELERINQLLIGELQGDRGIWNRDRLIRLGGTVTYPSDKKRTRGYVDEVTSFKVVTTETYAPAQLARGFAGGARNAPDTAAKMSKLGLSMPNGRDDSEVAALLDASRVDGQWHHSMLAAVASLIGKGHTDEIIRLICAPYCDAGASDPDLTVLIDGGRRKWNKPNPTDDDDGWSATSIGAAKGEPPPPLEFIEWDEPDETKLPPRRWIVPGVLIRGYVSLLVAPGGVGKSLMTIQLAIAMAAGEPFGALRPRRPARTLILNAEDDPLEMNRRRAAAQRVMQADSAKLKGKLFVPATQPDLRLIRRNAKTGQTAVMPAFERIREFVRDNQIDVIVVDPLVETFEGFDENSNGDMNIVLSAWRDLARTLDCAVLIVHHTGKAGANSAGDANASRGASAITAAVRISMTLMGMTKEEAAELGVTERNRFVRIDDAKTNLTLKSDRSSWFEKLSVNLENGTDDDPPDSVGALLPWTPPGAFGKFAASELRAFLAIVTAGVPGEGPNTFYLGKKNVKNPSSQSRWVGTAFMEKFGVSEEEAYRAIEVWRDEGVLVPCEVSISASQRSTRKATGTRVDTSKSNLGLVNG